MKSQDCGVRTSIWNLEAKTISIRIFSRSFLNFKVIIHHCISILQNETILMLYTYFVTLKIRKSLRALNTDKPKEPAFGLKCDHITSKTLPEITMQSKRLNEAWKYILGPKAHILKNISKMNKQRKTYSVQSINRYKIK